VFSTSALYQLKIANHDDMKPIQIIFKGE